jgi:hypothetical protein
MIEMTKPMSMRGINWSRLPWVTSSACAGNGCVQVAAINGSIAIRDSKKVAGPVLMYSAQEWREFVEGVKLGDFDHLV